MEERQDAIADAEISHRQGPGNLQLGIIPAHAGFRFRLPGAGMQVEQFAAGLKHLEAMGAALWNQQGIALLGAQIHGMPVAVGGGILS